MAFVLENDAKKTFDFKIGKHGKMYHLPLLADLPLTLQVKIAALTRKNETEELIKLLIDVFEKYAPGSTKELTAGMFTQLITAWREASPLAGE